MSLFRKKQDPLAQRATSLNRRIAELEAEIHRLNRTLTVGSDKPATGGRRTENRPAAPAAEEPVMERMPVRPVEGRGTETPGKEAVDLGLKRPVWSQWWRRWKARWVDPPPSNAKLVNYLAAGSIQGLRPLRYERRVARNRIVVVCVILGLSLWGLLIVFWQAR